MAVQPAPPPPPAVPQPEQSNRYVPPETPQYRPPAAQPAQPLMPSVPPVAAAMPPAAHQPVQTGALPDFSAISAPPPKKKKGLVGRFFKTLFVLALLGGIAAAGIVYGPTAYDEIRARTSDEEPEAPPEPDAPLAFPVVTAPIIDVRNATFVLDDTGPDAEGSTRRYEITTDFETKITRVVIERSDLPTLEVLTFLDQAVVRRMGDETWYRTPRGQFPLDDQLERTRWVRYVDELIPVENRVYASIEESTTANLGGERMRRMVVSIDPTLLAGPAISSDSFDAPPIAVAPTLDAAVDKALSDQPDTPVDPSTAPAGIPVDQPVVGPRGTVAPVSLELWIDARGLIRQLVAPDVLGDETLTIVAVSPDEWIPVFPVEEQVQPLTASALVELGL
ncbi:MAG: hypothetical protein ACR2O6_11755 [Ilumatobacteraceae bacterium]